MQAIIDVVTNRPMLTRSPRTTFRCTLFLFSILAASIALTTLSATPLTASAAPIDLPIVEMYLAPTGQTIQGAFLQAFQEYGLSLIGYPLTSELNEGGRTVQYFERVRMEYHPELAAQGTPVLFTRLGANISAGSNFGTVKPFSSTDTRSYFSQTGHSVAEPFLSFWQKNGGITLFGYPISEVIEQDGMQVQWFERARMEYHPELAAQGFQVQLTLLGRIAYSRAYSPPPPLDKPVLVNLNSMEAGLLADINTQRAAAGVPPVSITEELTDFARWRSNDMASRNYFAHITPEGKSTLQLLGDHGISYSYAGEILQKNNFVGPAAVSEAISSFLQSSAHRSIMLDPRYTQVGVGYAQGSGGMNIFTGVFISK